MSEEVSKKKRRKWNSERYPKAIVIRVTDEEHREINRRAELARMSTSRYLTHCGLKEKAPKLREQARPSGKQRELLEKLIYEVHKAGSNINQVAYSLNSALLTGGARPESEEIRKAARSVVEVLEAAREALR